MSRQISVEDGTELLITSIKPRSSSHTFAMSSEDNSDCALIRVEHSGESTEPGISLVSVLESFLP
jgi:hypothetical protein